MDYDNFIATSREIGQPLSSERTQSLLQSPPAEKNYESPKRDSFMK